MLRNLTAVCMAHHFLALSKSNPPNTTMIHCQDPVYITSLFYILGHGGDDGCQD